MAETVKGDLERVDQEAGPSPASSGRERLRRSLRSVQPLAAPLGIFAASRLAALIAAYFATRLGPETTFTRVVAPWDGGWYLRIAQFGYSSQVPLEGQSEHAFFPGYPLLIRAVARGTKLGFLGSSLLVTLIASAIAMVLIWLLVERLIDRPTATRTVTLVSFFPWSFIFSMTYSEGLVVMLAAACMLALLSERWFIAGITASLAGAVRPNALGLMLACGWAAAVAARRSRSLKPLVAALLAPSGLLGFCFFLYLRTGDFLAYLQARRGWAFDGVGLGTAGAADRVRRLVADPLNDINFLGSFISLALIVIAVALMIQWRPPAIIWLYVIPILGFAVVYTTYTSMLRFMLTAFPLLIALARRIRGTPFAVAIGVSAAVMATVLMVVGTTTIITI